MSGKHKAIGLVIAAVMLVSAFSAPAASAKQFHSGSASGTTYIKGVQVGTNQFDLENGTTVKCSGVVFHALYAGTTASSLTVTPTYSGCTAAGALATIHMNGCNYVIETPFIEADSDHYKTTMQLSCPFTKIQITVPIAGCTIEIGSQFFGNPFVEPTNNTTATANQDDILFRSLISGISYTTTGGGICGKNGSGKLTGEVTLKGYSNSSYTNQVDLFIV